MEQSFWGSRIWLARVGRANPNNPGDIEVPFKQRAPIFLLHASFTKTTYQ